MWSERPLSYYIRASLSGDNTASANVSGELQFCFPTAQATSGTATVQADANLPNPQQVSTTWSAVADSQWTGQQTLWAHAIVSASCHVTGSAQYALSYQQDANGNWTYTVDHVCHCAA